MSTFLNLKQSVEKKGAGFIVLIDPDKKNDEKVIGLVENMSTHICPNCGHEDNIFGTLGVKREAEALNLPFLGDIPLDRKIRENGDKFT